jgi:mannose-6-phosphate isomerase-like protein (cupin superfamily)
MNTSSRSRVCGSPPPAPGSTVSFHVHSPADPRLGAGGGEPHTLDRDEVFMVLSGTVQVTPDGDKLGAGDAAVVLAGEPIRLTNLGEGPAELYVAITAGFTGTMADGTTIQPPWAQ